MPRFVVLFHRLPAHRNRASHWDFMLEFNGTLRTWALEQSPDLGGEQAAEALPDHRLAYLDYEGPISGDRGEVARWDAGSYEAVEASAARLTVVLSGQRLRGTAYLQLDAEHSGWRFRFDGNSR